MEATMLPASRQSEAALHVLQTLRAAGHQAYLAGGCVRDLLLGREPKDFDVATSATPEVVLALFPRTFAVGAHFGVVLVATCGGADAACAAEDRLADQDYVVTEVATFRSDGVYSDGRHPDAVKYTLSAEEDVRRRDFTINGLLLDPEGAELVGSQGPGPFHPEGAGGVNPRKNPANDSGALAPECGSLPLSTLGAPGLAFETGESTKSFPQSPTPAPRTVAPSLPASP